MIVGLGIDPERSPHHHFSIINMMIRSLGTIMSFEIKDLDVAGRVGLFKVGSKSMDTPNLFPVIAPFENLILPTEIIRAFWCSSNFH